MTKPWTRNPGDMAVSKPDPVSEIVMNWATCRGVEVTPAQIDALEAYRLRVLDVNKYMNLTAITDPEDFAVKHFIDSLTLIPHIPHKANLIDIGTGAGFPGMVLRIMRDDLHITLLDATRKRLNFLRETAEMLDLPVEIVHARAEDHARTHGGTYDICTARAVARLDKLATWALPLVKNNGTFLAMKGPDISDELENATPAIKKYGGRVKDVCITELPGGIKHSIVSITRHYS